jgi:APA family basic amino acid/polyamine antiporter
VKTERSLGLDTATALVVGEIIGVGIFLTPAEMTRALGSPFWVLVVWLGVGATVICGSLCYGELAARYPQAGGGYVYLREAWGPAPAFLYGWMSLLIMDPGLSAALGVGFARYAGALVPLGEAAQKGVAIAAILVLAAITAAGVRVSGGVVRLLTALKLLLLGAIVVWSFASGRGSWSHFEPFFEPRPGAAPLVAGLAVGLMSAFYAFGGFWDVAKIGGEVREPTRTLPRALVLGVGVATIVYVLTSAAFLYLVPIEAVDSDAAFAAQAGAALFGGAGARVFAAIVLVTIGGSLAAVVMTAPRVYVAMARDRVFFSAAGRIDPRFGTPLRAIALEAVLASIVVALAGFKSIVAYFVFVTVAFVALTVAGLYRLPRPAEGTFRVPGWPLTPLAFLALLAVLLVILAAGRPFEAALGTAVVAAGFPVYRLFVAPRARRSPEEM